MSLGGLDQCACKRGFFTLRDCSNAATTSCSICSRRVCDQHLAPRVDVKVCVECAARQEAGEAGATSVAGLGSTGAGTAGAAPPTSTAGEAAASAFGPPLERLDPTSRAVRFRTSYYRSRGYSPMWWGTYDPYWDSWDYRWYDSGDDDDDGGGFGDS